jgi:hypothetical protein
VYLSRMILNLDAQMCLHGSPYHSKSSQVQDGDS